MVLRSSIISRLQSTKFLFALFKISIFFFPVSAVDATSFKFSSFNTSTPDIFYEGDSYAASGVIQLTRNQADKTLNGSSGRATYSQGVPLWNKASGKLADFTTHFSFNISSPDKQNFGDGLAFFLVPEGSRLPNYSAGGALGLATGNQSFNSTANPFVAVEFDTFNNFWDPKGDHIGIDINSIKSVRDLLWDTDMKDGKEANAWISYNSSSKNLSVFLTYDKNPVFDGNPSLSYEVDLRKYLPERVTIGFSAATGDAIEIHRIRSWEFNSTLNISETRSRPECNSTWNASETRPWECNSTFTTSETREKKTGLIIGCTVGASVFVIGLVLTWFLLRRKKNIMKGEDDVEFDASMDNEFEKGRGPKRFSYSELVNATNNFHEEGKLGEGGFGGVYRGFLRDLNLYVAVKRVSRGSKQGIKEYASEVKIISQLRHRNLVQLIGWCHERRELLLVYEFLPNGSLDSHLFRDQNLLTWEMRYKIALGLASALFYLHEEWEQCVVHRDIKSSNVMLDSSFNAKLGDFGLARLVNHGQGSQTTVLAGTIGYMAPECAITGKASKESDVFSFGIVALEIASGRRPVLTKAEEIKIRLVEWVWELHGRGKLLDAADPRLSTNFDEQQMKNLMIVGLWCAHPDYNLRPSIGQVIRVLNFEAPLPILPSMMPVATYIEPPLNMNAFSIASSSGAIIDSGKDRSQISYDFCSTNSSRLTVSSSSSSPSASLLFRSQDTSI